MNSPARVAGVVLAGGKSSRMSGRDKSLRPLAGKPLVARAIERLTPQVIDLVINANGDPSRFTSFGLPVIADSMPDYAGPLAGVHAGLAWFARNRPDLNYVVTVAGDTPFFPADLVHQFLSAMVPRPALVVARSDERVHPVFGLWPVAMAPDLEKALKQGMRKVGAWARQQGAVEVYFPKVEVNGRLVDPFFNINRPEDLAEAEALLVPRRVETLKD